MPDPALPPPPALPRGRWSPLLWLLAAGALVALASGLPIHGECGFRFVTGAPCPGCGMTRAAAALARLDPGGAWRLHPLVYPSALLAAAALAAAVHEGLTGRPTFRRPAERLAAPLAVAILVLFAAVWIVRVAWVPRWSPDPIRPGSPAARLLE